MPKKTTKNTVSTQSTKESLQALIEFKEFTVPIVADRENKEEVIEEIKKAILEQINKKIPNFTYYISNANVCTFANVKQGQIIRNPASNELGVVIDITAKNLFVVLRNSRVQSGHPSLYELIDQSEVNVDSFMWERLPAIRNEGWHTGDTGFIVAKDRVIPVVMGKTKGAKKPAYIIQGEGRYYPLTEKDLKFVFDSRKEAEEYRNNKTKNKF